jgi:hypothetical protein
LLSALITLSFFTFVSIFPCSSLCCFAVLGGVVPSPWVKIAVFGPRLFAALCNSRCVLMRSLLLLQYPLFLVFLN